MSSAKREERRLLLEKALAKVRQMKKGSAFITDWSAYELIQELIQEILRLDRENQNLIEKLDKKI